MTLSIEEEKKLENIENMYVACDKWLSEHDRTRKDVLYDENKKRHYVIIEMEMEHNEPGAYYDSKFYVPEEYEVAFF